MHGPQDPQPPPIPELIHRNEANQAEVEHRLAGHAHDERARRAADDTGPQRISTLLEELVYMQGRVLDLQIEQTRLLQSILQAVAGQGA
jgi:hypothetical protein